MRVLMAPAGPLGPTSAVEAATAMREGWLAAAPGDDVDVLAVSDGGAGTVEVLHAALGGELVALTAPGPHGDAVPAVVLVAGDTAYVEAAQVAGDHLVDPARVAHATSAGLGHLLAAAAAGGVRRVVVAVGGCGVADGGAGLLAALGARADRPLDRGPAAFAGVGEVDLAPAHDRLAGIEELVVAQDVTGPLAGLLGLARAVGTRHDLDQAEVLALDGALDDLARATHRRTALGDAARAGGGAGFALALLGATGRPGFEVVADVVGLPDRAAHADLVVTGETSFRPTSRAGAVQGVAHVAARGLCPCVLVGEEVLLGGREMRALGIEAAYAVVDEVGPAALRTDPRGSLRATVARVARTWSR